jgi:hypothetical protein
MGGAEAGTPSIRYFPLDTFSPLPLESGQINRGTRGDREGGDTMAKKKAAKKKKKK